MTLSLPAFAEKYSSDMTKAEMKEQTKINLETYIKEEKKAEGLSLSRDEKIQKQKNIALEYMVEKEKIERQKQIDRFWFGIGSLILFSIFLK
jgi:hypothetical protein